MPRVRGIKYEVGPEGGMSQCNLSPSPADVSYPRERRGWINDGEELEDEAEDLNWKVVYESQGIPVVHESM